jgi:hypothetical protein
MTARFAAGFLKVSVIGVIAEKSEQGTVEEFFELFKTPWEYASSEKPYDILLITADTEAPIDAPVVIVYGSGKRKVDERFGIRLTNCRSSALMSWRGRHVPIYGMVSALEPPGDAVVEIKDTHETIGLRIGNHGRTLYRFGFDLFREVASLLRTGQPVCHASIPTLDIHIELLRHFILSAGMLLVEIPPVPARHAFIACLTHDVDFAGIRRHKLDPTMFGFLYRALFRSFLRALKGDLPWSKLWKNWLAAVSLPLVWLGVAKDFMVRFDRYIEIEGALPSTFFFIPFKNQPGRCPEGDAPAKRLAKYDVTEIRPDVRMLASKGKEVALHGLDAWLDVEAGREELNRVKGACSDASAGVRMHWLYFSGQSPAILEKAGFAYDSTSGYNDVIGYRAGTVQVYRLPGTDRMFELPLHVMDTALFLPARMALTQAAAYELVDKMMTDVSSYGGAFTLNWHCRSLGPERFWDDFYSRVLNELKERGAWFGSAEQVVRWFGKRRSVTFHSVRSQSGGVEVDLSCGPWDGGPDLILRVHAPDSGTSGYRNPEPKVVTRDIPIHGEFRQWVSLS